MKTAVSLSLGVVELGTSASMHCWEPARTAAFLKVISFEWERKF